MSNIRIIGNSLRSIITIIESKETTKGESKQGIYVLSS